MHSRSLPLLSLSVYILLVKVRHFNRACKSKIRAHLKQVASLKEQVPSEVIKLPSSPSQVAGL